jgi:hypothetical protein
MANSERMEVPPSFGVRGARGLWETRPPGAGGQRGPYNSLSLETDAQADFKRDVNSTTATTAPTCFYGSLSFHDWILLSDSYFRIDVRRARQLVALSLGSCVGYFLDSQNSPSDPSQRRSRYGWRLAARSITALPADVGDCIYVAASARLQYSVDVCGFHYPEPPLNLKYFASPPVLSTIVMLHSHSVVLQRPVPWKRVLYSGIGNSCAGLEELGLLQTVVEKAQAEPKGDHSPGISPIGPCLASVKNAPRR